MNRRQLLTTLAGSAAGVAVFGDSVLADEPAGELAGWHKVALGRTFHLAAQSTPVVVGDSKLSLINLGECELTLAEDGRLIAEVKAAITQYAKIDYWISLAVLDDRGRFLGAATHQESVQYVRLGGTPTIFSDLKFDFGVSKAYRSVARLAVAISDRDIPMPG